MFHLPGYPGNSFLFLIPRPKAKSQHNLKKAMKAEAHSSLSSALLRNDPFLGSKGVTAIDSINISKSILWYLVSCLLICWEIASLPSPYHCLSVQGRLTPKPESSLKCLLSFFCALSKEWKLFCKFEPDSEAKD